LKDSRSFKTKKCFWGYSAVMAEILFINKLTGNKYFDIENKFVVIEVAI
jgi:hypothetical protein